MTHEYNKALCDACWNGYVSVVKLGLENGADPTEEVSLYEWPHIMVIQMS